MINYRAAALLPKPQSTKGTCHLPSLGHTFLWAVKYKPGLKASIVLIKR